MKKLSLKENSSIQGSYIIRTWDSKTGKLIWQSPEIKNLVVSSSGYGKNIVVRQLAGDTTYPIEIDSASIGTGSTAPTTADTGLQTSVLSGIAVADTTVGTNTVTISFFIADANLANGTYREFGIFMGGRLFARSLIIPVFNKASGQNVTVDYTITLT